MLSLLHIENIAVIKSVDFDFFSGFMVLTGETAMEDVNESNAPDVILNNIGEILDYLY